MRGSSPIIFVHPTSNHRDEGAAPGRRRRGDGSGRQEARSPSSQQRQQAPSSRAAEGSEVLGRLDLGLPAPEPERMASCCSQPFSTTLPLPWGVCCGRRTPAPASHLPPPRYVQFSRSVVSDPLRPQDYGMPGLPVHHQLLEFTQTHVHRVGDAIQPSHPLSSPSPPALNLSHNQGLFQ